MIPFQFLTQQEWVLLARHFPMGEDIVRHGAMEAWKAGVTGKGVKVAVIDDGMDEKHPAFSKTPVAAVNKSLTRSNDGTQDVKGSHGTAVASAILALAPEADIINIKIGGSGHEKSVGIPAELLSDEMSETVLLVAIEEAVKRGARVINFSGWSKLMPSAGAPSWDRITKKIQEVIAKGVVVVSTTGNMGGESDKSFQNDNLRSIAALPEVIGVGAADYFGRLADFSSRSQVNDPASGTVYAKPDVLSYGDQVRVATFSNDSNYDGAEHELFSPKNGTSFAAPQVAAIAALTIQKLKAQGINPSARYIKRLIVETAVQPEACSKENNCETSGYGHGLISLKGILERLAGPTIAKTL